MECVRNYYKLFEHSAFDGNESLTWGNAMYPRDYRPVLGLRKTEEAIRFIKSFFQEKLAERLNLSRVSAPLFVLGNTGVNDGLSGVEKPIKFNVKDLNEEAEIVQSLAKWKRVALADYGFSPGEGLYTDMNAIRPDEKLDCLHSIYVDQWDWERIINPEERNLDFLKSIVRDLYDVIKESGEAVCRKYELLTKLSLPEEIFFIHSEELEDRHPNLAPPQREDAICREKGAVFIIGIGADLKSGKPHDARAADYDDWFTETSEGRRGLNGDIIVWHQILGSALELSSMGIRVEKKSLLRQLEIKNETYKKELYFHRRLLEGDLPLTIGGGLGQSRLCMYFLSKAHIGEVQSSIWSEEMRRECVAKGIILL